VTFQRHSVKNATEDAIFCYDAGISTAWTFSQSGSSELEALGHGESGRQSTSGWDLQNTCWAPYTLAGVCQSEDGAKVGGLPHARRIGRRHRSFTRYF
jgi:hypothetical protein